MKKILKSIRYYLLFCPLHFHHYSLQPAIDEDERKEFMERFHQYDVND